MGSWSPTFTATFTQRIGCAERSRDGSVGERPFVGVAPHPCLPRLGGGDDGMSAGLEVLGGVPVRRGVAAGDVTAGQALSEVDPAASHLEAVLATRARALHFTDLHFPCVPAGRLDQHGFELGHGLLIAPSEVAKRTAPTSLSSGTGLVH